jgi:hypothetical protein
MGKNKGSKPSKKAPEKKVEAKQDQDQLSDEQLDDASGGSNPPPGDMPTSGRTDWSGPGDIGKVLGVGSNHNLRAR